MASLQFFREVWVSSGPTTVIYSRDSTNNSLLSTLKDSSLKERGGVNLNRVLLLWFAMKVKNACSLMLEID